MSSQETQMASPPQIALVMPTKIMKKKTDHDNHSIPRAIWVDPLDDVRIEHEILRAKDAFDATYQSSKLRYLNEVFESHGLSEALVKRFRKGYVNTDGGVSDILSVNDSTREVVLTDWGIDILNPCLSQGPKVIKKPSFRSPLDTPLHLRDRKIATPKKFKKTIRFGSWLNALAATNPEDIELSHEKMQLAKAMEKAHSVSHVLRYKRAFVAKETTHPIRGLSFRGRGLLDVKMGWSTQEEVEHKSLTQVDITDAAGFRKKPLVRGASCTRSLLQQPSETMLSVTKSKPRFQSLQTYASETMIQAPDALNSFQPNLNKATSSLVVMANSTNTSSPSSQSKVNVVVTDSPNQPQREYSGVIALQLPPTPIEKDVVVADSSPKMEKEQKKDTVINDSDEDSDDAWLQEQKKLLFNRPWQSNDTPATPQSEESITKNTAQTSSPRASSSNSQKAIALQNEASKTVPRYDFGVEDPNPWRQDSVSMVHSDQFKTLQEESTIVTDVHEEQKPLPQTHSLTETITRYDSNENEQHISSNSMTNELPTPPSVTESNSPPPVPSKSLSLQTPSKTPTSFNYRESTSSAISLEKADPISSKEQSIHEPNEPVVDLHVNVIKHVQSPASAHSLASTSSQSFIRQSSPLSKSNEKGSKSITDMRSSWSELKSSPKTEKAMSPQKLKQSIASFFSSSKSQELKEKKISQHSIHIKEEKTRIIEVEHVIQSKAASVVLTPESDVDDDSIYKSSHVPTHHADLHKMEVLNELVPAEETLENKGVSVEPQSVHIQEGTLLNQDQNGKTSLLITSPGVQEVVKENYKSKSSVSQLDEYYSRPMIESSTYSAPVVPTPDITEEISVSSYTSGPSVTLAVSESTVKESQNQKVAKLDRSDQTGHLLSRTKTGSTDVVHEPEDRNSKFDDEELATASQIHTKKRNHKSHKKFNIIRAFQSGSLASLSTEKKPVDGQMPANQSSEGTNYHVEKGSHEQNISENRLPAHQDSLDQLCAEKEPFAQSVTQPIAPENEPVAVAISTTIISKASLIEDNIKPSKFNSIPAKTQILNKNQDHITKAESELSLHEATTPLSSKKVFEFNKNAETKTGVVETVKIATVPIQKTTVSPTSFNSSSPVEEPKSLEIPSSALDSKVTSSNPVSYPANIEITETHLVNPIISDSVALSTRTRELASQGKPESLKNLSRSPSVKKSAGSISDSVKTGGSVVGTLFPMVPSPVIFRASDPEDYLKIEVNVDFKGIKCSARVSDFSLNVIEVAKGKPVKHFFPLELRRVVAVDHQGEECSIQACTPRKGNKTGAKFKKVKLVFQSGEEAKTWAESLKSLVFGGAHETFVRRQILIIMDKHEKDSAKLYEKYMKEVFEASGRVVIEKTAQYNEFSIANTIADLDFKGVGHIVCFKEDFGPRLQQLLVRNQYAKDPALCFCERDPVDAALVIIRSSIGRSNESTVFVSGLHLKREEGKLASLFSKFKS